MSLNDADKQTAESVNWGFEFLIDGVVALLPSTVVTLVIADEVTAWGSSPIWVFLGTLALSVGAFLIALMFRHFSQIPGWLIPVLAAGALFVAGLLAGAAGQNAPDATQLPPILSPSTAGAFALGYLAACWEIFKPLGFALSIASGIYLAWRVQKLYERVAS